MSFTRVLTVLGVVATLAVPVGLLAARRLHVARAVAVLDALPYTGHALAARPAGDDDVVVEFADYQCPYCAVADAAADHAGAPRIVYHHFPLAAIHEHAIRAAVAAECAARQDHFVAYHHALFRHQQRLADDAWVPIAREVGVPDVEQFRRCLSDPAPAAVVERDLEAARTLGLEGTPAFIVGRTVYYGALPESASGSRAPRGRSSMRCSCDRCRGATNGTSPCSSTSTPRRAPPSACGVGSATATSRSPRRGSSRPSRPTAPNRSPSPGTAPGRRRRVPSS